MVNLNLETRRGYRRSRDGGRGWMGWRLLLIVGTMPVVATEVGGTLAAYPDSRSDSGSGASEEEAPRVAATDRTALEPALGNYWDGSLSLRTWSGYRDNPQLSSVNPMGSAFMAGGGELMIFRVPMDGWEATFYGLIEHLGYLEPGLAPETIGVFDARVRRIWPAGWMAGLGLEYFFLKQVFDASEIVGIPVVIPAEGHTLGFRPRAGREFGNGWRWEVEPELARQWLGEPLDNFLDTGARWQVVRSLGRGSEWSVSYRFRDRAFDVRPPRDESGLPLEGTLRYGQHEWESIWKAHWDEKRHWRTTFRGGYLLSRDNGGGYFDYDRLHFGGQVRYSGDALEMRAEAKARWYSYPVQRADDLNGPRRRRSDVTFLVRGDWKVRPGLRIFAQYDMEISDENVTAADYRSTSVSGGVELEM